MCIYSSCRKKLNQRFNSDVLYVGRCVTGTWEEVLCRWLVFQLRQYCCLSALCVCAFFTKNIMNLVPQPSYGTDIVPYYWNSSCHGMGVDLMTSHLQNSHRLCLPSTKHMLPTVMQSSNMLNQVTMLLLQRGQWREKIHSGCLSVVLLRCVCTSPFV
jgi:hypothetical protein